MSHRHVQHTVTVGSFAQAGASFATCDWHFWTVLTILVGLLVTLIWVWAE